MAEEQSQLPMGWGVHILEGLNKSLVSWLFCIVISVVITAGAAWSCYKQKGVSVASLCLGVLAIFASFVTSEYFKQSEI